MSYDERPRAFGDQWKHDPRDKLDQYQQALVDYDMLFPSTRDDKLPRPKGKVPAYTVWQQHLWLLPRAAIHVVVRYLFMKLTGWTIHPVIMYAFVFVHNVLVLQAFDQVLHNFAHRHGYLDGEMERDSAPPAMAKRVVTELRQALVIRPLMVFVLSYDRSEIPHLSLWLPVQLCIFTTLVDFFYYWVHRLTHENDRLWKLHRKHHTTKHPTAYMLAYADEPQELFDMLGSPMLAYMLFPLSFDALCMWSLYFGITEYMGHAGLRVYYPTVLTGAFLRPFECELVLEDHDLHHRFGWRDSFNYGKQTKLWDALFGTCGDRIETNDDNIDWSKPVY